MEGGEDPEREGREIGGRRRQEGQEKGRKEGGREGGRRDL